MKEAKTSPIITATNLSFGYGDFMLMKDISFQVNEHDIFIIMGGSGCGKSTLLHILTGLKVAAKGKIIVDETPLNTDRTGKIPEKLMHSCGILYQGGALFSSMTLFENIAMPLQQYTDYSDKLISELVSLKLALVGLAGFEEFYPSEISGGMCKRAGLARALALDPKIVYCDEPSAGLDPISSRNLDDLFLELNSSLGTTFVIVTHELPSIFTIGSNSIYLDGESKSILARGNPKELLKNPPSEKVRQFLTRGEK